MALFTARPAKFNDIAAENIFISSRELADRARAGRGLAARGGGKKGEGREKPP